QAVLELEEAAQERLLRRCERRHVRGTLTATQNGAQSDHEQFMQVMQAGVTGSRILQSFEAGDKLVQRCILRRLRSVGGRIHRPRIGQAPIRTSRKFQVRFPWGYNLFSLTRASAVVKCQSALACFLLRLFSHAATSSVRVCLSAMRRSRHWLDKT